MKGWYHRRTMFVRVSRLICKIVRRKALQPGRKRPPRCGGRFWHLDSRLMHLSMLLQPKRPFVSQPSREVGTEHNPHGTVLLMYMPMGQCVGKVPQRMANPEPTRVSLVGPAHQRTQHPSHRPQVPTILPIAVPSGHPSTRATRTTVSYEEILVPGISSPARMEP
jgi:hypothetical protein